MKFLISSYRRLTAALFTTGKPRPLAAVIGGENKRVKATRWLAFVTRSEQWPPLTQSVERETLNLRVVGSSPTLSGLFLFVRNVFKQEQFYKNVNFPGEAGTGILV